MTNHLLSLFSIIRAARVTVIIKDDTGRLKKAVTLHEPYIELLSTLKLTLDRTVVGEDAGGRLLKMPAVRMLIRTARQHRYPQRGWETLVLI